MPNRYPTSDSGSYPGYRRLKSGLLKQAEQAANLADLAVGLDDIANSHWELLNLINESSVFRLLRLRREVREAITKAEAETKAE